MSVHKLSAGSGIRLPDTASCGVRCHREGTHRVGLLLHRTGESPGGWIGSGMAGIDGRERRGSGPRGADEGALRSWHASLGANRVEQLDVADQTDASIMAATQLGAPFKVCAGDVGPFRVEVARRIAAQQAARQQADEPVSAAPRPDPNRGRAGVLPSRAWPRSNRCPRDRRPHRQTVASA
jgi:hypothetical protein